MGIFSNIRIKEEDLEVVIKRRLARSLDVTGW
jgi:hypothetical protein